MRKLLLSFYFACCILHFSFSQNPLVKQWDKRFGGTGSDWLHSFQQTADGGYILGGISLSGISGDKTQNLWGWGDYWIVKTDSLGNKEWDKDFGGTDDEHFSIVQQIDDGGYILGGSSESPISGDKTQPNWDTSGASNDFWIVKIDSLGVKQWDKVYGGTSEDWLFSVQQTFDGGYILGGASMSGISGDKTQPIWDTCAPSSCVTGDYWIIKIDSLGNKQWDKDFGALNQDGLISLKQTTDGGYILGGSSYSGISGDKTQPNWDNTKATADYWIIKIDSLGNKQWDKRFGGTKLDALFSIQQTNDKGYILGGWSFSGISGDKTQPNWDITKTTADYWIVKIDSLGIKQWDKTFGGTDMETLHKIFQMADGSYFLSGTSHSGISGDKTENNLGNRQIWIIKTDSLGSKQWDKTIFTIGSDEFGYSLQSKDGCFAMGTATSAGIGGYKTQPNWNPNNYYFDYWIIKFCDTTLTTGISPTLALPEGKGIAIAPNPANEYITINYQFKAGDEIQLTDVLGKLLFTTKITVPTLNFKLPTLNLSTGIYFLKAGNEVKKFVKE